TGAAGKPGGFHRTAARAAKQGDRTIDALQAARIAASACAEKKAADVRILEVRGLTIVADYFVICTAGSATNARAIADHVALKMKQAAQRAAIGTEGRESGWWVLSDFGDVILHVFQDDA